MVRIHTGRLVASMTYAETVWDRPFMQLIAIAMRQYMFLVVTQLTIAVCRCVPCPHPTDSCALDIRPETFEQDWVTIVATEKANRLTDGPFACFVTLGRKVCSLPTATLALAIGRIQAVFSDPRGIVSYAVGKVRSIMELHRKFIPSGVKPRALVAPLGSSIDAYSIARIGELVE